MFPRLPCSGWYSNCSHQSNGNVTWVLSFFWWVKCFLLCNDIHGQLSPGWSFCLLDQFTEMIENKAGKLEYPNSQNNQWYKQNKDLSMPKRTWVDWWNVFISYSINCHQRWSRFEDKFREYRSCQVSPNLSASRRADRGRGTGVCTAIMVSDIHHVSCTTASCIPLVPASAPRLVMVSDIHHVSCTTASCIPLVPASAPRLVMVADIHHVSCTTASCIPLVPASAPRLVMVSDIHHVSCTTASCIPLVPASAPRLVMVSDILIFIMFPAPPPVAFLCFQPVLHDWYYKSHGVYYLVLGN